MIGSVLLMLAASAGKAPRPYFPLDLASPTVRCSDASPLQPKLSDFENRWFSAHLLAAHEPVLFELPSVGEVIRFTWLRSFDHPVIVRVTFQKNSAWLVARELSGAGGYNPGTIARRVDRRLTEAEVVGLRAVMVKSAVFGQPEACGIGFDGAEWIFESNGRLGYRFAKRWSPQKGEFREMGTAMIKLTGWNIRKIY